MTNSQIDRLSNLPDALLVTIISFLPTAIAVRTSALCRRFRHIWETSPSLELISRDHSDPQHKNFVTMANRALLSRNPSHPLLSLHLEFSRYDHDASFLCSLLAKARSLDLRHLTINICWSSDYMPIVPIIFTIKSLRCLSFETFPDPIFFPSGTTLTCLRSLSLGFSGTDTAKLNPLLSQLCSLEDLHLHLSLMTGLSLSSQTIRKLKLIISLSFRKLDTVVLSFPSLESLHLETIHSETHHGLQSLAHIRGDVPLLRKAVINLRDIHERNVSAVAGLLNWISHVEELSLHIKQSPDLKYPIPILFESGKDVPKFSNLKNLDVTLSFYKHNLEDVIKMIHNCPLLKSLRLVHEIPELTFWAIGRRKKIGDYSCRVMLMVITTMLISKTSLLGIIALYCWSKFMKLLSEECTSKS